MGSKISKAVRRHKADKATDTQTLVEQTTSTSGTNARDSAHACHQDNTQVVGIEDRQERPDLDPSTNATNSQRVDETANDVEVENTTPDVHQPSVGQLVSTTAEQSAAHNNNMSLIKVSAPVEETIMCIVCRDDYHRRNEGKEIIYPCRHCESAYCGTCLKRIFIRATEKPSDMPPRCCGQLQLHVAKPFLSEEEAAAFRAKYDEWSTKNPMYCPVPTCSVFIPNRLLKESTKTMVAMTVFDNGEVMEDKGKQRVDSVIGTPNSTLFNCPSCQTSICVQCRQLAHPGLPCSNFEFGQVDEATAALLKGWGYKRCPKCGTGVRRMYGCNHMQCLCGAHWCWVCQLPKDECDGDCYEAEDEYDPDYEDEVPVPEEDLNVAVDSQERTASDSIAAAPRSTRPTPTPRERNLDAGSRNHWEGSGFNFGEEPSEDVADRAWECYHSFARAKVPVHVPYAQAPAAAKMECSRCWTTVYAEMESPSTIGDTEKICFAYECSDCGIVVCEQCKGDC